MTKCLLCGYKYRGDKCPNCDEPAYLRPDYESDNVARTMWEKSE